MHLKHVCRQPEYRYSPIILPLQNLLEKELFFLVKQTFNYLIVIYWHIQPGSIFSAPLIGVATNR